MYRIPGMAEAIISQIFNSWASLRYYRYDGHQGMRWADNAAQILRHGLKLYEYNNWPISTTNACVWLRVRADDKLGLNDVHPVFMYADINVLDDIMEIMNTVNNSAQA